MISTANIDQPLLQSALETALQHIERDLTYLDDFPHRTVCGAWEIAPPGDWVQGFWAGLLWLRFAYSGDPAHRQAARQWTERLYPRAADEIHDLGFLFETSAVMGHRLTGEAQYRDIGLQAAAALRDRLRPGGWIQAFGPIDHPARRSIVIIDAMLNLKLLAWAAQATGEERYLNAARLHAANTMRSHVRDDGRTYHVVHIDPETGEIYGPRGGQGLTPASCWSRGQAWGIYGYAALARATQERAHLDAACLLADAWLTMMAGHEVPPWDFDAPVYLEPPDLPPLPRDTSAAAITACGLLELAAHDAPQLGENGAQYRDHALALVEALCRDYLNPPEQPGILREGTSNLPQGQTHQALIYGDYYFVEALLRLLHPEAAARALGL